MTKQAKMTNIKFDYINR